MLYFILGSVNPLAVILSAEILWWIAAAGAVAAFLILLGRRQMLEGRDGTWLRLIYVAFVLSLLATAPLAMWAVLVQFFGHHDEALPTAILTTVVAALVSAKFVIPIRLLGAGGSLPSLERTEMAARVDGLAKRMRVPAPTMHEVIVASNLLQMMAGVNGLQAPSMVVFPGITRRLEPDEQDAIFAHELAHLANRSFWYFACVFPIAGVLGVIAVYAVTGLPGFLFALLLSIGINSIVQRYFETDSDRRAGQITSFRAMQSALAKIHAEHGRRSSGWPAALANAVMTHPHRDVRIADLYRFAPEGERGAMIPPAATLFRHRLLSKLAVLTWLGVLGFTLYRCSSSPAAGEYFILPLAAMAMAPIGLWLFAHRGAMATEQRRMGTRRWRPILKFFAVLLLGLALTILALAVLGHYHLFDFMPFATVAFFVPLACVFFVQRKGRRVRSRMSASLIANDFEKVLATAAAEPAVIARSRDLRYTVALVRAVAGDRTQALAEFRELAHDEPRFALPHLALAAFLSDEGNFNEAIEVTDRAIPLLPKDPLPWAERSHILLRAKQLPAAREAAGKALQLNSEFGTAYALLALIAMEEGNFAEAERQLNLAEDYTPGDSLNRYAAARLAVARSPQTARSLVEAAIQAINAEPYGTMKTELAWFKGHLSHANSQEMNELQPLAHAQADINPSR